MQFITFSDILPRARTQGARARTCFILQFLIPFFLAWYHSTGNVRENTRRWAAREHSCKHRSTSFLHAFAAQEEEGEGCALMSFLLINYGHKTLCTLSLGFKIPVERHGVLHRLQKVEKRSHSEAHSLAMTNLQFGALISNTRKTTFEVHPEPPALHS